MGRVIVGYEGRETLDDRIILPEALRPRGARLPIFYDFSYTTALGWAEDFGRRLNPETGWMEISFELYFRENWEDKIRVNKLIPTIGMTAIVTHRTPYDQPEMVGREKTLLSAGEINCVSFGIGLNAWGESA